MLEFLRDASCANVPDAKTGEMFFSQQTWKVHMNDVGLLQ
jgi:hypothetical protein